MHGFVVVWAYDCMVIYGGFKMHLYGVGGRAWYDRGRALCDN